MNCGLALFSVFNKGLLECHHLQEKKKRRVFGLYFRQDVSAIPSEAEVEKFHSDARVLMLNNPTLVKANIFPFFPPVKELWSLWLAVCTHCFAVDLTTPQACKSQTGRSEEE